MRRPVIAAAVCVAVLLCAAPAALALTTPLHAVGHGHPPVHARFAKSSVLQQRAALRFEPLARRLLSGTGTISLNVYGFNSQPEVGAEADWWVFTDTDYGTGSGTTDANGHVELTGVPEAASGNGELAVFLNDTTTNAVYDLFNMSWPASGWIGGLQPGHLPITLVQDGDGWKGWSAARTYLWAQNGGGEQHLARTDVPRTGSTTNGTANTITTGQETLTSGATYFWMDEGMELDVSGTQVSPASTAQGQLAYQNDAQRLWMDAWGSGKPGTTTWLVLNNYPAGWVNDVYGQADYPATAKVKSFGTSTTNGDKYVGKKMTIPSTAAPGYAYYVWANHEGGPLSLETWFQTCTLKPSKATVARGATISLSGIVPIKGHRGSTKGTPKYVSVYKTTSAKTARYQPAYAGGGTVRGWTKVGRVRTDGLGKYRKGSVKVAKTTWYSVWYPGDSWYWGAWTSVAKVTAR